MAMLWSWERRRKNLLIFKHYFGAERKPSLECFLFEAIHFLIRGLHATLIFSAICSNFSAFIGLLCTHMLIRAEGSFGSLGNSGVEGQQQTREE